MIAATFICGTHGADDVYLPHKLRVLSALADRVCVVLDRSLESEAICRRFPKVEVRHVDSDAAALGMRHDGPTWSEGKLRQAAWDMAVESRPERVILGDADEIPAPAILELLQDRAHADCVYADWVNLIGDPSRAIGGTRTSWSFQADGANKKGLIVRHVPGRVYRYRLDMTRHVRMEPSPLHQSKTIFDADHVLGPVPLLHYRWANWPRWQASEMATLPAYQPWPPPGSDIISVPREWLWRWDADDLLASLPGPIAVVGNGPCVGKGAEIDGAATVIRFNNWVTEGHESHVGGKTTLWVTNCWDDVAPRPWAGPMCTVYTDREQSGRVNRWLGSHPHMHVPQASWTDAARRFKPDHPTTGFVTLARLLHHGKRVSAYGFDGLNSGHYWNPDHRHNHRPEAQELEQLARAGVDLR